MTNILLVVHLCIARFCLNVGAVGGAVVFVKVGYKATDLRLPTVSVRTWAVIGVMVHTLAVVASVENWTGKGSVGHVWYLAMRTLASGD